jgi:hypothetical protein
VEASQLVAQGSIADRGFERDGETVVGENMQHLLAVLGADIVGGEPVPWSNEVNALAIHLGLCPPGHGPKHARVSGIDAF